MTPAQSLRMDKTAFSTANLTDTSDEKPIGNPKRLPNGWQP